MDREIHETGVAGRRVNTRREFFGIAAGGAMTNFAQQPRQRSRQSFDPFTLQFAGRSLTSVIAANYPQVALLDSLVFQFDYDIIGYDLNASFFNVEPNVSAAGVFIIVGKNSPTLAISNFSGVLASVLCPNLAADDVKTPDTSPLFFDDCYCIPLPAGTPLSLYGCNTTVQTRLQAISAVGNVYLTKRN